MNEDAAAFYDPEGSSPDALGQVTLFQGDVGSLNPEQRRTFVTLLKRRYISADTHPAEWAELLAAPHVFRTRFNDMYLTLEINTVYQVAYTASLVRRCQTRGNSGVTNAKWRQLRWNLTVSVRFAWTRRMFHPTFFTGINNTIGPDQRLLELLTKYNQPFILWVA
ncbi:DUF4194 domain-containing protein [Cryobacterium sp. Y29]|uniref:DUF4194 domain-containing protein n=1 Tax=Cryobacterium sp. Y29 TaxID=2048285 RepID=UPI000CE3ECA3|nr:DUF4194 domain-containing protein [Cryobacterium sp. Y29]